MRAYLWPGMGLNLGELEFSIVGVHVTDLFVRGSAEDLDDLHQLVDSAVPREDGLSQKQLREHTARRPDV